MTKEQYLSETQFVGICKGARLDYFESPPVPRDQAERIFETAKLEPEVYSIVLFGYAEGTDNVVTLRTWSRH